MGGAPRANLKSDATGRMTFSKVGYSHHCPCPRGDAFKVSLCLLAGVSTTFADTLPACSCAALRAWLPLFRKTAY
jgi:hypothetical protein